MKLEQFTINTTLEQIRISLELEDIRTSSSSILEDWERYRSLNNSQIIDTLEQKKKIISLMFNSSLDESQSALIKCPTNFAVKNLMIPLPYLKTNTDNKRIY